MPSLSSFHILERERERRGMRGRRAFYANDGKRKKNDDGFPNWQVFLTAENFFCDLWELLGSKGLDEAFK